MKHAVRISLIAAAALLSAGAAAAAQAPPSGPNYMFADGMAGFSLTSHGGPINPGVLVGFNPQPDPPGDGGDDGALIALLNPSDPELFNPKTGPFTFTLALVGMGGGSVFLPDVPEDGHHTSWQGMIDGHDVDVTLGFGPGAIVPGSWESFNPQPEPPGDVFAGAMMFRADPIMTFGVTIDGSALSFDLAPGVPEPATWALMLMGFGGLGAVLRARRRTETIAA